jgi:hypothetical protein
MRIITFSSQPVFLVAPGAPSPAATLTFSTLRPDPKA